MWSRFRSARHRAGAVALALAGLGSLGGAPPAQAQASHQALWGVEQPLVFRLSFDRKAVSRDRDTLSTKTYPAVLTWTDSAGAAHDLGVTLRTRGHFRLAARNCDTPPPRLRSNRTGPNGGRSRGRH